MAIDSKFTRRSSAFAMTCSVQTNVRASTAILWNLLTDAQSFPRWNSTIKAIEGEIRAGQRLRLHVSGTSRIFTPKISGIVPQRRMIWSDGLAPFFKGVRTFVLNPRNSNTVEFVMEEHFSGVVFALTRGMLPDFQPIFEAYASDLKREAERIAQERVRNHGHLTAVAG